MKKTVIRSLLLILVFVAWLQWALSSHSNRLEELSVVTVDPDFELNGVGSNVDSIAFWEAPDPNETFMFITAKENSLIEVWQFPFVNNEKSPLTHSSFGSSPVNGVFVEQNVDQLYVSVGEPASTVSLFSLPNQTFSDGFINGAVNLHSEPNLALLNHTNRERWAYVSADEIVFIHHAATGTKIGEFTPLWDVETMVADDYHQVIYIPDENDMNGVFAYQPDGTPYQQNGTNNFGNNGIFQSDAEGIIIYACRFNGIDYGSGFIAVADQKRDLSDFEFFDRQSWEHLGTLNLTGVSNTDGLGTSQQAMTGYPEGILTAINNDSSAVGVGWDKVLNAMGLSCQLPLAVKIKSFISQNVSGSIAFLISFIFLGTMTSVLILIRFVKVKLKIKT